MVLPDLSRLRPHERTCLGLMAFVGRWMTRSQLSAAVRLLDVRVPVQSRGKQRDAAVNPTNLRPWMDRWADAGLVERRAAEGRWLIDPVAQHVLLDEASKSSALMGLSLAASRNTSDFSGDRLEQALRLALYSGDAEGLLELLGDIRRMHHGAVAMDVLLDTLRVESPPEAIARIPTSIRADYLQHALHFAVEAGRPARPDLVPLLDALTGPKAETTRALALTLFSLHAETYPGRFPDPKLALTQEALAVAALVGRDVDAARVAAMAAWELSKTKRRKPRLEGPLAPLLTLVLATGDGEARAIALAQCASPGRRSADTPEVYDRLSTLLGGAGRLAFLSANAEWACMLTALLVDAFTDRGVTWRHQLDHVLAEAAYQREHGFAWVSTQLEHVAAAVGAHVAPPEAPWTLLDLFEVREPWEEALEALETQLDLLEVDTPTATTDQRLVWFIELMQRPDATVAYHLRISPKLQKQRGSGWTKGRPVALKRLLEGSADEPWMTAADRKVVAHIQAHRDWYGSTDYAFDAKTPLALVGHPRVFWEGSTPVRVQSGQPTLRVEEKGGSTQVELDPAELEEVKLVLRRRDDTTLEVFDGSKLPAGLVALLARGVLFPAAASSRLGAALTRLAPLLPIHGEVEADAVAAEQVDADTRPVLEVARHEDGVRVEIIVLPLGDGGPRLAPGQGARQLVSRVKERTLGCTRDLAAETQRLERLMQACPSLHSAEVRPPYAYINDLERSLELLDELRALPAGDVDLRWKEGDHFDVVGRASSDRCRLTIATADEWFAAQGEVEVDEGTVIGLRQLLDALPARKGRFVPLDDTRFVSLTQELTARLETLQSGLTEEDESVRLHPVLAGVVAGWANSLEALKLDRKASRRLRRVKEAVTLEPEIPATFDGELRSYQIEGFQWMQRLAHWGAGACLADDMGLGKTVQALAVLLARGSQGPALVVAPTSVCAGWVEQAARFAPGLRLHLHSGGPLASTLAELSALDVLVCSYTVMALGIDELADVEFTTVVLDEAQAIKNAATQRAKAAHRLKADFRLATTGTPIENHLFELWSLMQFLDPGLLGSEKEFERRFARPIQRDGDEAALQVLRRVVSPFVLRRTKREVLQELPPRTELVLEVEPTREERAFTEALRQRALERIAAQDKPTKKATMHVLAELTRLRQAACAPALVEPEVGIPSSKLEVFLELVAELIDAGHRALVFSQFVGFLRLVREALDARNITYKFLDGSTPSGQRKTVVRDFQAGEGDLFLISLKAGGTGLNLTAADYVIHLDPWWNPAVEDQASDRAHRIGQTRPVTVYRLVTKATVEERVLALHGQKRDLADQLLAGRDDARPLDAEALLALIG